MMDRAFSRRLMSALTWGSKLTKVVSGRGGSGVVQVRRDVVVDTVVALILYVLFVVSRWALVDVEEPDHRLGWEVMAAVGLLTLPLSVRRRAPLSALVAVSAGYAVYALLEDERTLVGSLIPVLLAIYGAGVYGRPIVRDVVRAAVGITLAGLIMWMFGTAIYGVLFAGVWILGDQTRLSRERERELMARTVELEAARERNREQAANEERLHIARELHDVLGHHVSVMGVQAAGAQRVLTADPERARGALEAIERSSRDAVIEMQRVLALLRVDGDRGRPELARVEELIAEVRDAGVQVSLEVDELGDLPTSVDRAATRVVQEALTNVLRHVGTGASVWVRITKRDGALHIVVEDDGHGAAPDAATTEPRDGGRGLVGLRERVEFHSGRFHAGPRSPAGFRVVATLPLGGTNPDTGP